MIAEIPISTHQRILDEACGAHSCGDLIARTRLSQKIMVFPSSDMIEQDVRTDEVSLRVLSDRTVCILSGPLGAKLERPVRRARSSDERILFNYQLEQGRHLRDSWSLHQESFQTAGREICQELARSGASAELELRLTDYRYFNNFGAICRRYETDMLLSGTCLVPHQTGKEYLTFQERLTSFDAKSLIALAKRKDIPLQPPSLVGQRPSLAFHPDILERLFQPVLMACAGEQPLAIGTSLMHRRFSVVLRTDGPESFDDEGYPVHDHEIIGQGQLQASFHNSVTARQQGWKNASTGHAFRGLQGPLRTDFGRAEIIATRRGVPPQTFVYVREIKTHHRFMNPQTGDFSFVAGIEVHTPQGPLYRLPDRLISGNCFRLWRHAFAGPGPNVPTFSGKLHTPPIFFDESKVFFNP